MRIFKTLIFVLPVFFLISCSSDETSSGDFDPNDPSLILWQGPEISFEKLNGSDPDLEQNQDRISDNVWITRDNTGGQIYNAVTENVANKSSSPAGTEWAIGSLSNLENLSFSSFRNAVGDPKDVVGKDLVLRLVEENIFIDVRFTSWSQGKLGGFAYERSTP